MLFMVLFDMTDNLCKVVIKLWLFFYGFHSTFFQVLLRDLPMHHFSGQGMQFQAGLFNFTLILVLFVLFMQPLSVRAPSPQQNPLQDRFLPAEFTPGCPVHGQHDLQETLWTPARQTIKVQVSPCLSLSCQEVGPQIELCEQVVYLG